MSTTAEATNQKLAAGGLSLELTRHFNAKPGRVFEAWLGDEWGKWLPPGGATCSVTTMEPKVGGSFVVAMVMQDGRGIEIHGKYVEIDRPNRLVMTWTGSNDGRETILSVTFTPEDGGTRMVLKQEGFVEQQLQQGYIRGWEGEGGSFEKLAHLL